MFTSIIFPDHSERILQTPASQAISINDAKRLASWLKSKLPSAAISILGLPAGGLGGDLYTLEWMENNIRDHNKPLILEFNIYMSAGQAQPVAYMPNIAALAHVWLRSKRHAAEDVLTGCGFTVPEIQVYYTSQEVVQQAINSLWE